MSPVLGIIASSNQQGRSGEPTGSYDALTTIIVPSGGLASIVLSGIPAGYRHLQLRASARSNRASATNDPLKITFNGDTSTNYSQHYLTGSGSGAPTSEGYANESFVSAYLGSSTDAIANNFGFAIVDILDYSSTNKFKTTRAIGGSDNNGSGLVSLVSGNWRSTAAISSLTIIPQVGTLWNQNSTFSLYGIK